jgi:transcription elongation factor GreA
MNEREYLTQEKFDEFNKELDYLKHEKRTEIARSLEYAKSLGDLSENAEYHEARDAQARVEDRINYLEALLKSAQIVSSHDTSRIAVGAKVVLKRESDKQEKVVTFVGSEEADASTGKISVRSPLGVAALGREKGDSFSFQTPSGSMTYKVIDIQ